MFGRSLNAWPWCATEHRRRLILYTGIVFIFWSQNRSHMLDYVSMTCSSSILKGCCRVPKWVLHNYKLWVVQSTVRIHHSSLRRLLSCKVSQRLWIDVTIHSSILSDLLGHAFAALAHWVKAAWERKRCNNGVVARGTGTANVVVLCEWNLSRIWNSWKGIGTIGWMVRHSDPRTPSLICRVPMWIYSIDGGGRDNK